MKMPPWVADLALRGPWAKAPVWLYRNRLGWVLGHRAVMIAHVGRRTGRVHETVVEALRYNPTTKETIAVSGFGDKSDWFRNIQERPALFIHIGRERFVPEQRVLDDEAAYQELVAYRLRYPRTARAVFALMGWDYDATDDELRQLATQVRVVAFRREQVPASTVADLDP